MPCSSSLVSYPRLRSCGQATNAFPPSAITGPTDLEAAVLGHEDSADHTRADLELFFESEEVKAVAGDRVLDLDHVCLR